MMASYLLSYAMDILSTSGREVFLLSQAGVPIYVNLLARLKVKLVSSNVITRPLVKGAVEPVEYTFKPRLPSTIFMLPI